MGDDDWTLGRATEVFMDATLHLLEGKDDDDLVFLDGFFRGLAEQLGITVDFAEIEPMTAGQMRERYRAAKRALADGDGPSEGRPT